MPRLPRIGGTTPSSASGRHRTSIASSSSAPLHSSDHKASLGFSLPLASTPTTQLPSSFVRSPPPAALAASTTSRTAAHQTQKRVPRSGSPMSIPLQVLRPHRWGKRREFEDAQCGFFLRGKPISMMTTASSRSRPTDFARINPNTGTAPILRTRRDAEIISRIYREHSRTRGPLPAMCASSGLSATCRACST